MSRRDEIVASLDTAMSQLQTRATATLLQTRDSAVNSSLPGVARIASLIDGVIPTLPSRPTPPPSNLPFSSNPAPTDSHLPTVPYEGLHQSIAASPSLEGDELPSYSRRAQVVEPPPPTRLHRYTSKSNKLLLEIPAAGTAAPTFLGRIDDTRIKLAGTLKLTLPQAEDITHIRVRVKGITRTLVLKERRHPVADEITFYQQREDLYESTGSKLEGSLEFPFELYLPPTIIQQTIGGSSRTFKLPPSFVLSSGDGLLSQNEWASCRYYIKVTLGRKGFLKVNERLIVPLIFLPRSPDPIGSARRMQALEDGRDIPGPAEDPSGWSGRKLTQPVKRGTFRGKKAWYTVIILVPTPATFSRLTSIPFQLKIVSSDPEITTKFPKSTVSCILVQRAEVIAQGLPALHDTISASGEVEDEGPPEGEYITRKSSIDGGESPVWGKRMKGSLKLTSSVGSTFAAPNLSVSFLLVFRVACPGVGNNAELAIPIEISSSLRSQTLGINSPASTAEELDVALPPSYFEVIENRV